VRVEGLLLIASSKAGSTEAETLATACAVLRRAYEVEQVETEDPAALERALDGCGRRRLVVAGGDGSLHLVVQRLRDRDELDAHGAIGLLPLGTGNDLARALSVPLDPEGAAAVICAGRERRLDLLVDDAGGVVLNAVHLGVGASAAAAAGRWKSRMGPLAYPLGAVTTAARAPGWRTRVTVDGEVLSDGEEPLLMVGVANGPGIGGGTPLVPRAVVDDGWLDVVTVRAGGLRQRVGYGSALRSGTHLDRDDVHVARGRSVTVSGEPMRMDADGELGETVVRRTWSLADAALPVLVPDGAARGALAT
jgi:diacylglycerol kinase family enzyme